MKREGGCKEVMLKSRRRGGAENAEGILLDCGFWISDLGYGRVGCIGLGWSYAPCWVFSWYLVVAGQRAGTGTRPYTVMGG